MRIFSLPPPAETLSEPNFYDTISKIRLRQQLEMYSICKYTLSNCIYVVQSLSPVWLFAAPRTVAHQASLSMRFTGQEYWSGLPFLLQGDLSDLGIEPSSPAWQADCLPLHHLGSLITYISMFNTYFLKKFVCSFQRLSEINDGGTGNYIQYPVTNLNGKEYVYICVSLCYTPGTSTTF